MTGGLQTSRPPMPSFSKDLWFQCQAFPKNVLAVLWDFKDLQASKSKVDVSPNFFGSVASSNARRTGPNPCGLLKRHGNTVARVSFFRKRNREPRARRACID